MNNVVMINATLTNASDTFEAVKADVEKYAKLAGVGSNSRENFLIRCVKGGARGALSSEASKDKDQPDHARQLYMAYEATRRANDKAEHDAEPNPATVTSKASNFRTAIMFGQTRDEEAIEMINRAWSLVSTIPAKERRQPFECLNRVIVEAMKDRTRVLSDDEMRAVMMKNEDTEKKSKTAADYLREARKRAEQAEKLQANSAVSRVIESIDEALRWLPSV